MKDGQTEWQMDPGLCEAYNQAYLTVEEHLQREIRTDRMTDGQTEWQMDRPLCEAYNQAHLTVEEHLQRERWTEGMTDGPRTLWGI